MNTRVAIGLIAAILCAGAVQHTAAAAPEPARRSVVSTPAGWAPLVNSDVVGKSGIATDVLNLALGAVKCAVNSGDIPAPPTLTVIDYSRPSVEPRLWVFDLHTGDLLFKELVAHGRGSGDNIAARFSDDANSHESSLGLFVTRDTYIGHNGYSLRLDGLEPGFNDHAMERAIVMHGAPYVNGDTALKLGRLGRSWGCPALRQAVAHQVIDTVRGGGVIFSYFPDQKWLKSSQFLNGCGTAAPRTLATN